MEHSPILLRSFFSYSIQFLKWNNLICITRVWLASSPHLQSPTSLQRQEFTSGQGVQNSGTSSSLSAFLPSIGSSRSSPHSFSNAKSSSRYYFLFEEGLKWNLTMSLELTFIHRTQIIPFPSAACQLTFLFLRFLQTPKPLAYPMSPPETSKSWRMR